MLLVTADQMREMDRQTIEEIGLPGIVLMERAALGATEALRHHFDLQPGDRVALICGGGNNGGDGFAMARMLNEQRIDVWVGMLRAGDGYTGDAATNLEILHEIGVDTVDLSGHSEGELTDTLESVGPVNAWVDAIFGTGLDRNVEGSYAAAIDFLKSQSNVFAVDIPSGVHADSSAVMGTAVRARATATFGHPKLGQALYPGRDLCGTLYPIDIGIPASVSSSVGWRAEWLLGDLWLPPRPSTMHKGTAGRLLAVGGEPGKTGAIIMTVAAALRSGAGLVTAGTYDDSVGHVAPAVPEAMAAAVLAEVPEQRHEDTLEPLLERADVVAIGPGLGTHGGALDALQTVLDADVSAVVIDADGLTLLAEHRMQIREAQAQTLVLTPHPGEAARLCGCDIEDILEDPIGRALEISADWDAIVVLKGAATVVADAGADRLAVNGSGNPGMATGGMGDALTGIVAAQLCEAIPAFEAVCCAVWVHGRAGDIAAADTGQRGLTVSSLLDAIPGVWNDLEHG